MVRALRRPLLIVVLAAFCAGVAPPPASADGVADKAISWALGQNGHREVGTTNCSARITKWERAMSLPVPPCRPWCGAFVHQAFLRAGVRLSPRLIDPARSAKDALASRRGLRVIPIRSVRRGDLLFFALRSGSSAASHLAIVTSNPSGGKVRTIEGNIGHHVRKKTRGLRFAVLAARVQR